MEGVGVIEMGQLRRQNEEVGVGKWIWRGMRAMDMEREEEKDGYGEGRRERWNDR